MPILRFLVLLVLSRPITPQQIEDVWQTTKDQSSLLAPVNQAAAINFSTSGPAGDANIEVSDSQLFQDIDGFGASLTDSSALTLHNLMTTNLGTYNALLTKMFGATDGSPNAGLNYIRLPIGASDFSKKSYSWDDTSGDTSFQMFSVNNAPDYVWSVLKDILAINSRIKVHIVAWSPPGWMKDSGRMTGGSLTTQSVNDYPIYLLKAVQGVKSQGIPVYAISIQNEPQSANPSYASCRMTPDVEGKIGTNLRDLLTKNGLSDVKIIGYDHNWDKAGQYPVQLMQNAGNAFAGVAFHCYAGTVDQQDLFHNRFPDKEIYFTECTGSVPDGDWWGGIQWYMKNLFIGALEHNARNALMWNIALDPQGNPKLPTTKSCDQGCRALVSINSDGSYTLNQEFYAMAQASKAIIPKDEGGPFGQRIGVSVTGSRNSALTVGAYVTNRVSAGDVRYSLVVLNSEDGGVQSTISFRGTQAVFTFPTGITTLAWLAPGYGTTSGTNVAPAMPSNGTTNVMFAAVSINHGVVADLSQSCLCPP